MRQILALAHPMMPFMTEDFSSSPAHLWDLGFRVWFAGAGVRHAADPGPGPPHDAVRDGGAVERAAACWTGIDRRSLAEAQRRHRPCQLAALLGTASFFSLGFRAYPASLFTFLLQGLRTRWTIEV